MGRPPPPSSLKTQPLVEVQARPRLPFSLFSRLSVHAIARAFVRRRFRKAGLEERTIDLGEAVVHYWIGGSGPPLVLLHGFGGDATFTWHSQVKALARHHTLLIPDLLWFGESHANSRDFSLDFQARTVLRIANLEEFDRFDIAGISYGGLVAFSLTNHHGARVRRLIMIDSPGAVYTDRDHQDMLDNFSVDNVAKIVIPEGPDGVRTLLDLAWQRPPPTPRFVLRDVYRNLFSTNLDEKRGMLAWLDEKRQGPHVDDWDIPHRTLVVWGDNDPVFGLGIAQRLVSALPAAELVVLNNTRHAPNVERPAPFNAAVLAFLGA